MKTQSNLIGQTTHRSSSREAEPGSRLVGMADAKRAVVASIAAGTNGILYGPGGHAKSQLIQEMFGWWESQGAVTHIQTLNVQSNPIDLFGGLHPEYVKRYDFGRAYVERSWIANADVVCFEEIFDAPARVIASLKDLLVSRRYRYTGSLNGNSMLKGKLRKLLSQQAHAPLFVRTDIHLRTRSVLGLTNHDPKDIAKQDKSVSALVERFPMQVSVLWESYAPEKFMEMFNYLTAEEKIEQDFAIPSWKELVTAPSAMATPEAVDLLAELLGAAASEGVTVSPRMAVYCHSLITSWAGLHGRERVNIDEDFLILRLVAGIGPVLETIWNKAIYKQLVSQDAAILARALEKMAEIQASMERKPGEASAEKRGSAIDQLERMRIILKKRAWQDSSADSYKVVLEGVERLIATGRIELNKDRGAQSE